MASRPPFLANRPATLSVWAALLLIVIVGGGMGAYFAVSQLDVYYASVRHSYEVLDTLDDTLLSLQSAETGQRGFLLTGRADYLGPYRVSAGRVRKDLARLASLTADNPNQRRRLAALEPLVSAKLDELNETIALRSNDGSASAMRVVLTDRGKMLMDSIQRIKTSFESEERGLLRRRQNARDVASRVVRVTSVISSIAALILSMMAIRQVTRRLDADRRAREEAERGARMKEEFIATVSHELRTPLTSILGWTQMLRQPGFDREGDREALHVIEGAARAQMRLVDDLLDVSRISMGKMRLNIRPVVLADIVTDAIESLRPTADAKQIRLTQAIDPDAGSVSGDPDRLQQIVWNLLSNALKFTDKGGSVHVTLRRTSSHVEIVVADNGVGIDPRLLPHVFDRLRQADSNPANKGLGLGLAIVRQLVELHGGTVRAASNGKGTGSTFSVELPVAEAMTLIERRRDAS